MPMGKIKKVKISDKGVVNETGVNTQEAMDRGR